MAQLSPETVWDATAQELMNLLDTGLLAPLPLKVSFYAPSFMHYQTSHYSSKPNQFSTISITGKGCALNCKHCGAKLLGTMHPAETPEILFTLTQKLKQNGASGCLISGGCSPDGSVPIKQFIPVFRRIKQELGLTLVVHTGIVDAATAEDLKEAGVDAALIDIVGSNETIKDISNLNVTVENYENSLKALDEARLSFVPHVIVGLHEGRLRGEFQALKQIARYEPSALVVIAFMPIPGTAMALVRPPSPLDIARVAATARLMLPETPLALGCMRSKRTHRVKTDLLCLKAGVNAIAFPSEEAVAYAENRGYELSFSPCCCSQVYVDKSAE